jgi:hypothetical protein
MKCWNVDEKVSVFEDFWKVSVFEDFWKVAVFGGLLESGGFW